MAEVRPPCQVDHDETGREWADEVPYRKRREIQEMATQCGECPAIQACDRVAETLEARSPGSVAGIWGGQYRRDGQVLDPWGPEHGDFRSVYRYVWHDGARGTWRAEKVHDGERIYILSSQLEDRAGAAAWDWRLENDDV